jgi:ABC-type cobalamin/Fe3+-siderophores transport system ATPase subunit
MKPVSPRAAFDSQRSTRFAFLKTKQNLKNLEPEGADGSTVVCVLFQGDIATQVCQIVVAVHSEEATQAGTECITADSTNLASVDFGKAHANRHHGCQSVCAALSSRSLSTRPHQPSTQ